jgi:hypothetical protein
MYECLYPLTPRPTTHATRRLDSISFILFPYVESLLLFARRGLIRALDSLEVQE